MYRNFNEHALTLFRLDIWLNAKCLSSSSLSSSSSSSSPCTNLELCLFGNEWASENKWISKTEWINSESISSSTAKSTSDTLSLLVMHHHRLFIHSLDSLESVTVNYSHITSAKPTTNTQASNSKFRQVESLVDDNTHKLMMMLMISFIHTYRTPRQCEIFVLDRKLCHSLFHLFFLFLISNF